jgi:hypothetical protein
MAAIDETALPAPLQRNARSVPVCPACVPVSHHCQTGRRAAPIGDTSFVAFGVVGFVLLVFSAFEM